MFCVHFNIVIYEDKNGENRPFKKKMQVLINDTSSSIHASL